MLYLLSIAVSDGEFMGPALPISIISAGCFGVFALDSRNPVSQTNVSTSCCLLNGWYLIYTCLAESFTTLKKLVNSSGRGRFSVMKEKLMD